MDKIMNKFLHWLGIVFAVIVVIALLLFAAIYMLNPYVEKNQKKIEQLVANVVNQPIKADKIKLGIYGLEPVIKFTNLELFDPKNNVSQLKFDELDVGVDLLGSLFNWQLEPGLLFVKGANLSIIKSKDNTIDVNGVTYSSGQQRQDVQSKVFWLLSEGKIILKNVNLVFKNEDAEAVKFTDLNFNLGNKIFYRKLKMSGVWQQTGTPSTFAVNIYFHGSLIKHTPFSIFGDVALSHFNFSFADKLEENINFLIPREGKINVHLSQSSIDFVNLFRNPIQMDNVKSLVNWNKGKDSWQINFDKTTALNNELTVHGAGNFTIPFSGTAPEININGTFEGTHLENASLYFPAKIMNEDLVAWLDAAFPGGRSIDGKFVVKGHLSDFPFDNNNGIFLIDTNLHDVNFNYYKNWPVMENVNGRMIFHGRSLQINVDNAKIMNAPITMADATIPNLANATLDINGTINSDSSSGMQFIAKSPLDGIIGADFTGVTLSGPMLLALKLSIPLTGNVADELQVFGKINLKDNFLKLSSWDIGLDKLQGVVSFTRDSVMTENFSGELFSKPVAIKIATVSDANKNKITQIDLSGKVALIDLQNNLKIKLDDIVSGDTDYLASIKFYADNLRQNNSLNISSSLTGVNVKLPAPLKKSAVEQENLSVDFNFSAEEPKIVFSYGDKLSSAIIFKYLNNALQFNRGEVHLGTGSLSDYNGSGLFVSGNIAKLDLSVWKDYLQKIKTGSFQSNLIKKIDLNIDELRALGQVLQPVKIQASYSGNALAIRIQSSKILGSITIPDNYPKSPANCNFEKLYLAFSDNSATSSKNYFNPGTISALNFFAKDFRYGDKNLGQVQLQTIPDSQNNSALIIKTLNLTEPTFTLQSSGKWALTNGQYRTLLNGKITSNDFGKALKNWGMTESLANGAGFIQFYLVWPDAFYNPVLRGSSGNLSILVKNGRIINLSTSTNAEMGIGRVLNLFTLQSIPRRLTLDFSDLIKEGFSFDTMKGTYKIDNGNAYTSDTTLKGSVAEINVSGRIGLLAKDYNMILTVIPSITSSLPVIATVVGGPITGAVAWLAEKVVISKGVGKVARYVYKVTGSWLNPNVQKL